MILKFTDSNFKTDVLESDIPVLVDFYADWCGPCKMMSPLIDELAEENQGSYKIGKLDVDTEQDSAKKYNVMTIPTMIIFKNGKEVDRVVGVVPKEQLQDKLDAQK